MDAVVPAPAGPRRGLRRARPGPPARAAPGRGRAGRPTRPPRCGTGSRRPPSRTSSWPPTSPGSPTPRPAGRPGRARPRTWWRPAGSARTRARPSAGCCGPWSGRCCAATPAPRPASGAEIESFPHGPLRDAVLGSLATAADDPAAAERLLARAWRDAGLGAGPGGGRDDRAADRRSTTTAGWTPRPPSTGATGAGRHRPARPPLHATAQTYLLHGLGYAGRVAESLATAAAAAGEPGEPDQLWLNPRCARGLLRLVEDDLDGARADLASVASHRTRAGHPEHRRLRLRLPGPRRVGRGPLGRRAGARRAGGGDQSGVRLRVHAVGGGRDRGAGPGRRAATGPPPRRTSRRWPGTPGASSSATSVRPSRWACPGPGSGRPAATRRRWSPRWRRCAAFPHRDAADEPGFWPWQDLYADALVAVGPGRRRPTPSWPRTRSWPRRRGRRSAIARLARARGRIEAAAGRPEAAERAFSAALAATEELELPFERARIELAAGGFLRRAGQRRRAADLLTAAEQRFTQLGADALRRARARRSWPRPGSGRPPGSAGTGPG